MENISRYTVIVKNQVSNQPLKTEHQRNKQTNLENFAERMGSGDEQKLLKCLEDIKYDLSERNESKKKLSLFNNSLDSYWRRNMPESACLAMVGLVAKIFGEKLLTHAGELDQNKLQMAMQMLYGKDMHAIGRDMLTNITLTKKSGEWLLNSKHYELSFGAPSENINMSKFVNSGNVNQSYFHQKTKSEVDDFFGDFDAAPEIIRQCTAKNMQTVFKGKTKEEKMERVEELAERMKAGAEIYHNTTTCGNDEYTVKCNFLVDSKPTILRKIDLPGDKKESLKEIPFNAYQAELKHRSSDGNENTSHATMIGLQDNEKAAGKIIDAVFLGKKDKKRKILIDLRFLTSVHKKIVSGSEKGIFDTHKSSMAVAASKKDVDVYTLHNEHYGNREFLARAGGSFCSSSFTSQSEIDNLTKLIDELSLTMSAEKHFYYAEILLKWKALSKQLRHQKNAVPFATLTYMLVNFIDQNTLDNELAVELTMGCKSAKDRATSILTCISLLQPVIEGRLSAEKEIDTLLPSDGRLKERDLSTKEVMMLKELYDIRLLHIGNKFNTGVEGNISYKSLDYFGNLGHINHSKPYTVSLGS